MWNTGILQFLKRFGQFLVLPALLVACDQLPGGAALQKDIVGKSEVAPAEAGFAVYPVTRPFLKTVARWPETGDVSRYGWIPRERGPKNIIIRPGDMVSIAIWDAGENSLLTAPGQRSVAMQELVVAADGTIFVPYVERILVSGLNPEKAREEIQRELEAIVPSAQVQFSYIAGRMNAVDLVGGVASPGSYPLPDRDFTLLSLLSAGGGVQSSVRNPQARLLRDGKIYGVSIDRLYRHPGLDTTLRGGDKVIIEADKRYFVALGATGSEKLVDFERDELSALEAISMAGGVNDSRADLKGILILREYPKRAVSKNGVNGPESERAIFVIDLTTADGLFSAQKFVINSSDVVFATESPVTSVQTIFSLIGRVFGLVNAAQNVAN